MIGAEMMTKKQKKLMLELRRIAEGPVPWEFATVDVDAIKLALSEIERLRTENAEFKNQLGDERQRVADFAILFEQAKLEEMRLKRRLNAIIDAPLYSWLLLGQDDLEKEEVIE